MKNLFRVSLVGLVALILLPSGCSDDTTCNIERSSEIDYFPLSAGNWWAFESDTSRFNSRTFGQMHVCTLQVVGAEPSSDAWLIRRAYYEYEGTLGGELDLHARVVDTARVLIEGRRLLQAWAKPSEDVPCFSARGEIMHIPVVLGESWECSPDTSSEPCANGHRMRAWGGDTIEVSGLLANVATPAGLFTSVYELDGDNILFQRFGYPAGDRTHYARGVGPIAYRCLWGDYEPAIGYHNEWAYLVDYSVGGP